ncbi:MAG: hypothetical protein V1701_00875 [Planctomycetota bacterium]
MAYKKSDLVILGAFLTLLLTIPSLGFSEDAKPVLPQPKAGQPLAEKEPALEHFSPVTPPRILKLSEVRIGMKGYGKTVFEGYRIEKFGVEVFAILKNTTPKHDAILVRVSHHITDNAGIIQGMSGSPVYLGVDEINEPEGRLVGALSFGWGFSKEPIGGVTPIEYMIDEMNKPLEKESRVEPESDTLMAQSDNKPINGQNNDSGGLRPLMTPLFVSGLHPRLMKYFEEDLKKFNMYPIQSGGGSGDYQVPGPIEPGSALGVPMARGDLDLTGIGTVTYVDGNKLAAFGHSMDLVGETMLPMCKAYIFGTIPRLSTSFKLGVGAQEIGSLTQDRQYCVAGLIGKRTPMFPLKIKINNLKTGIASDFNMEIMHHKYWTPFIIRYAVASAITVSEPNDDRATVESIVTIKLKDYEPVTFTRHLSSSWGVADPVLGDLFYGLIMPLWNNPYKDIKLESMSVDLKVANEDQTAYIRNAWLEKDEVKPGETVQLYVALKPYKKPDVIRTVKIIIPDDMENQDLNIDITAGSNILPELPTPTSIKEMMNLLKSLYNSNNLITVIPIKSTNLLYNGRSLGNLPNSILSAIINQAREPVNIKSHNGASLSTVNDRYELINGVLKIFTETEYILRGSNTVRLKVRKK